MFAGEHRDRFESSQIPSIPWKKDLPSEKREKTLCSGSPPLARLRREILKTGEREDALARSFGEKCRQIVERRDVGELIENEQCWRIDCTFVLTPQRPRYEALRTSRMIPATSGARRVCCSRRRRRCRAWLAHELRCRYPSPALTLQLLSASSVRNAASTPEVASPDATLLTVIGLNDAEQEVERQLRIVAC